MAMTDRSAGASAAAARHAPAVEVRDLSFSFGPAAHRLQRVSLQVHAGQLSVLLGPNGAGKTTLLRCVLGLLTPAGGTIRYAGTPLGHLGARRLARAVAYVPQNCEVAFPFSTLDIELMGRSPHLRMTAVPAAADRRAALAALDELGIARLAERSFAELSGGERQLALIARALVQQAPLLVLDEPAAALDYGNAIRLLDVIDALAADGRAVLMTTHQPEHALTHAGRAVLMRAGTVVADGPPAEVITSASLTALYDTPIDVAELPQPGGGVRRTCLPAADRRAAPTTHGGPQPERRNGHRPAGRDGME